MYRKRAYARLPTSSKIFTKFRYGWINERSCHITNRPLCQFCWDTLVEYTGSHTSVLLFLDLEKNSVGLQEN